MRRIFAFVFCFMYSLCLFSCCERHENDMSASPLYLDEEPEKLVIYLSGFPSSFSLDGGESFFTLYPSSYMVGTRIIQGDIEAIGGNVFQQAIEEYGKKQGIEMEIHYIEEENIDGQNILQYLYENKKEMPDLVLVNKHSQYDYYRMARQDILLDFTPYIEADTEINNEDLYYQDVLKGGKIMDEQCVMPILFNMSGLITSDSFLKQIGMEIPELGASYEEILYLLKKSCVAMKESKTVEALYEATGHIQGGQYILSVLLGAAYGDYFDNDLTEPVVSKEVLSSLYNLMALYSEQEYTMVPESYKMSYGELRRSRATKSNLVESLSKDAYQNIGIFLSGGRSGGINLQSSLLMDAAYFHSAYTNDNQEMILCGIPMVDNLDSYTANISTLAFSFQAAKYPNTVYRLIRYLMDYSYPAALGFSVSKEETNEQLENVQETTMKIYPEGIWGSVAAGEKSVEEVKQLCEEVVALDDKTVQTIRHMLENIGGAGLPFGTMEWNIFNRELYGIGEKELTIEEAAESTMNFMKHHLTILEDIEPFYDPDYELTLQRYQNKMREVIR